MRSACACLFLAIHNISSRFFLCERREREAHTICSHHHRRLVVAGARLCLPACLLACLRAARLLVASRLDIFAAVCRFHTRAGFIIARDRHFFKVFAIEKAVKPAVPELERLSDNTDNPDNGATTLIPSQDIRIRGDTFRTSARRICSLRQDKLTFNNAVVGVEASIRVSLAMSTDHFSLSCSEHILRY